MAYFRAGNLPDLAAVIASQLLLIVLVTDPALAQGQGCTLQQNANPARQVLRCRDGLIIEAEAGADYALLDRNGDGEPDAASLRSRALLVESPAGPGRRGFQVLTPQAIAAVRGTRWVVDVDGPKTAVFVVDGRVTVRRPASRRGVVLQPGEGVDVTEGAASLVVRRWPAARVSALLARFGR